MKNKKRESRRRAASNGRVATPEYVAVGANKDFDKLVDSKKKVKPNLKPETPKPDQLFRHGQLVSLKQRPKRFCSTNGRIVGSEWGGDRNDTRRDIWLYWVKDVNDNRPMPAWALIPENQLEQIT